MRRVPDQERAETRLIRTGWRKQPNGDYEHESGAVLEAGEVRSLSPLSLLIRANRLIEGEA